MINIEVPKWIQKYLNDPKKCQPQLKKWFLEEMSVIYEDIEAGTTLVGDLSGLYKIDFDYKKVSYRIVYEILSDTDVLIVYCGIRENVYQKIKRNR